MLHQKSTLASLLIAMLCFVACRSEQKSENTAMQDSAQTAGIQASANAAPLSNRMARLMGADNEATFRTVNLGDPIAEVKAKEKAELFEDDANHVGYTIEYSTLESADILYYRDKQQKVNKIEVDLYLNNRQSVTEFSKELTAYLSGRFGKESQQNGVTVWNGRDAVASLKDVSKGKDFGLKLTFLPAGETLATRK